MSDDGGDLMYLWELRETLLRRWRLPPDDCPPAVLSDDLDRRTGGVIIECYAPGGAGIWINGHTPPENWTAYLSHEFAHWLESFQHTPRMIALAGALFADALQGGEFGDITRDEVRRVTREVTEDQYWKNRQHFAPGVSDRIAPLVADAAVGAAEAAAGRGAVAIQEEIAQRLPWWTGPAAWLDHWLACTWWRWALVAGILFYLTQ